MQNDLLTHKSSSVLKDYLIKEPYIFDLLIAVRISAVKLAFLSYLKG